MKKMSVLLLPVMIMLLATGCPGKKTDTGGQSGSVNTGSGGETETGGNQMTEIPAIITSSSAGCYTLKKNGSMDWVVQVEQYTQLSSLGEKGAYTYTYKDEERSGEFVKCRVDNNGTMEDLWILGFNVMENASLGVITSTCLLYSKDKMDKITDKEVTMGTIVFMDTVYNSSKFRKIRVPGLGTADFYVQSGDFSMDDQDVQVAMILRAVDNLGEGKEKLKAQLLQDALDSFPSSLLIDLVYGRINELSGEAPDPIVEDDMSGDASGDAPIAE
jgi:hypothetical protein